MFGEVVFFAVSEFGNSFVTLIAIVPVLRRDFLCENLNSVYGENCEAVGQVSILLTVSRTDTVCSGSARENSY